MLGDPPLGRAFWPAGPTGPAATGQQIGSFPCGITHDNIGYHIHVHLAIYLNGEALQIPNNLGIGGPQAPRPGCMYALHTHDATGVLHIESITTERFFLGQFFQIWGQPLSATNIAGISGQPIVFYVVDGRNAVRYMGDPAQIEFLPGRNIAIQIGTPLTALPTYRYN